MNYIKRIAITAAGTTLLVCSALSVQSAEAPVPNTPLPWAYALNTPGVPDPFEYNVPRTVPGSNLEFVFTNPRNLYEPPDWHPEDHPVMPDIVRVGREPEVYPCSYCHLPNGQGRPENSSLTGLPEAYILQQLADWRAGLRTTSEPQHGPATFMQAIGFNATEEEAAAAAAYFSSLTPRKWIRVVERATVPETVVAGWMYVEKEGGGREQIGSRILEMPEDLDRTELRDDRSGFIAYVPPGSIERGRQLVRNGRGNAGTVCTACHGEDLRGLGPVPPLAGRSPSYLARQLYDFQQGNRHGLWSSLMQEAVAGLTTEDMVDLAAYIAAQDP